MTRKVARNCLGVKPIRTTYEIAAMLGISQVRVQQLESVALRKLREHPVLRQLAMDEGWIEEPPCE